MVWKSTNQNLSGNLPKLLSGEFSNDVFIIIHKLIRVGLDNEVDAVSFTNFFAFVFEIDSWCIYTSMAYAYRFLFQCRLLCDPFPCLLCFHCII